MVHRAKALETNILGASKNKTIKLQHLRTTFTAHIAGQTLGYNNKDSIPDQAIKDQQEGASARDRKATKQPQTQQKQCPTLHWGMQISAEYQPARKQKNLPKILDARGPPARSNSAGPGYRTTSKAKPEPPKPKNSDPPEKTPIYTSPSPLPMTRTPIQKRRLHHIFSQSSTQQHLANRTGTIDRSAATKSCKRVEENNHQNTLKMSKPELNRAYLEPLLLQIENRANRAGIYVKPTSKPTFGGLKGTTTTSDFQSFKTKSS